MTYINSVEKSAKDKTSSPNSGVTVVSKPSQIFPLTYYG